MEMEHGLSCVGADVEHGAVSILDVALAGDLSGGKVTAADDLGVGCLSFFQSSKMFLGNDEHVRRGFRADVFKREDVVIFVNFFGRNFSANDAAEKTTAGGFAHDC
jgi:hypothetical protein